MPILTEEQLGRVSRGEPLKPRKGKKAKPLTVAQLARLDKAAKGGGSSSSSGFFGDLSKETAKGLASNVKFSRSRRGRAYTKRAGKGALGKVGGGIASRIARQAEIATGAEASGSALANVGRILKAPVVSGAAGVGVSAGTAAAAALIAGVASYYATTWILGQIAEHKYNNSPEGKRFAAAMAYRKARIDAAAQLKRPLTPQEQKHLADEFKMNLKTIGA